MVKNGFFQHLRLLFISYLTSKLFVKDGYSEACDLQIELEKILEIL